MKAAKAQATVSHHWRPERAKRAWHAYPVVAGKVSMVSLCGRRRGDELKLGQDKPPPLIARCEVCDERTEVW